MLNKVILMGNIGRTPQIFLTQEGREIAKFSLATTMVWKDNGGEWQSATDWHQITVFRESTVRWIKDLLKRGDTVYVEGKLVYQRWTDKYGQSRMTAHVVVPKQGGKVEYLRSSRSTSQNNPVKAETGQETAFSDVPSSLSENEIEADYPPFDISVRNFPSTQFSENTGETLYEN